MNKILTSKFLTISLFTFAFSFLSAFGGAFDVLLTFSTQGPDKYIDGSTVLDGESYAVVWTKSGCTFGGFAADGKLLSDTDKLVVVAGLAKDGRCPTTLFVIDESVAGQYKGGSFKLYLLDTRVKTATGVAVGGADQVATTAPAAVNAAGVVGETGLDTAGGTVAIGAVALADVGAYTKLDNPKITGIEIDGATVTLTVEGLEPTADYFVVPGAQPNLFEPQAATPVVPVDGKLTVEKKDGASFFKVVGARKFE